MYPLGFVFSFAESTDPEGLWSLSYWQALTPPVVSTVCDSLHRWPDAATGDGEALPHRSELPLLSGWWTLVKLSQKMSTYSGHYIYSSSLLNTQSQNTAILTFTPCHRNSRSPVRDFWRWNSNAIAAWTRLQQPAFLAKRGHAKYRKVNKNLSLAAKNWVPKNPDAVGLVHIINCHKPKTVIDFQGEIEMFLLVDYNVHLRISFTERCLSTTAGVHSFYSADLKGETSREQSK